jgi:DNA-binding NarL/FixJ family response regulator
MLLELARRMVSRDRTPDSPLSRLSPRERQALALPSRGWDNARIGRDLFISQHTVRTHIQNILEKLACTPGSRPPPTPCSAPRSWS